MEGKIKMILKIFLIIIIIIIVLILLFLIFLCLKSKGKILKYNNTNSIAEKRFIDVNGNKNGIIIRGKNLDNPVLLFISGGPGVPEYWLNEYYKNNLEDYYTVCWWDYLGEGLSYNSNLNKKELTIDRLIKDGKYITDYLKKEFEKDKIYIMGHSAGTTLSLKLVSANPDDYYAYFAMGQVINNGNDRYTYGYNFMKDIFIKNNDKNAIKMMDELVIVKNNEVIPKNKNTIMRDWENILLRAGCATTRNMHSDITGIFFPNILSECYTITEKINYWKGKILYANSPYFDAEYDLKDDINIDIPIYFIQGFYDYTTPTPLVERLYEKINVPEKDIIILKNSAHSPLWEENDKVIDFMISKFLL